MKSKPLVSVIVNCFNGEKYLSEAIDSVLSQNYINWELIFWDNLSIDSSAEIFIKKITGVRV
jgi:glycosyltransferase involved in cell wall biosynthesis